MIEAKKRDAFLDGLKFLLIFLVILGHIKCETFGFPLLQLIYSFHMPLFIMISGYLSHVKDGQRFWAWCVKTIGIYLIFCSLHLLVSVFILKRPFSLMSFVSPPLALWYLLSLVFWRSALQLASFWNVSIDWRLLSLSFLLIAPVAFIPVGQTLSFQRTFAFSPFFLMGYLCRQGKIPDFFARREDLPVPVLLLFLVACFFLACQFPFYQPREPVEGIRGLLVRYVLTINAFVLIYSILQLIPRSFTVKFARLGEYTLYFYLYHTLFVRIQEKLLLDWGINLNVFHAIALAVLYVILIYGMHKVRVFRWLLLER